jgi:AraC-like DNA-binding protein
MRETVVVVGCQALDALPKSVNVVVLAPQEIYRRPLAGSRLIVIGQTAIEQLDADDAWRRLASVSDHVVLSMVGPVDPARFAAWLRHGYRFVSPDEVQAWLAGSDVRRFRPIVAPEDWLPHVPPPGSAADHLVQMIALLPRLTVNAWAQAAGISRSHLLRTCSGEFGTPARNILQRYILAAFRDLARRCHVTECAEILGLADAATLRRAIRRAERASRSPLCAANGLPTKRERPHCDTCLGPETLHHITAATQT